MQRRAQVVVVARGRLEVGQVNRSHGVQVWEATWWGLLDFPLASLADACRTMLQWEWEGSVLGPWECDVPWERPMNRWACSATSLADPGGAQLLGLLEQRQVSTLRI